MKNSILNKIVLVLLFLPVFGILFITISSYLDSQKGLEITLPISGYDPRDLLSGHYLTYTIDYGVKIDCKSISKDYKYRKNKKNVFVCLDKENKKTHYQYLKNCETQIKGYCKRNQFKADIERFYISENKAKLYDQLLRDRKNKAQIKLMVKKNGKALVKDIWVNEAPIKTY